MERTVARKYSELLIITNWQVEDASVVDSFDLH